MKLLKKLKFWDKSQDDAPELPDDIKHFQAERAGEFTSNIQKGHVPASAGEKAVAAGATIFVVFAVGVFLWLYFHEFLFNNHT